jgi:hypothetical protein
MSYFSRIRDRNVRADFESSTINARFTDAMLTRPAPQLRATFSFPLRDARALIANQCS